MLVKFNIPKTRIMFVNESGAEYKAMMKFPAFQKEGPYFFVPAKVHVVFNVINRLQSVFKRMQIDKDVFEFMNLEMTLKALPDSFKYITKPMTFQDIALRYMYTVESGGLLLDPGMGKTKVVLDFIALMGFKKSWVICPKPLLFVWEDEVAIHRPDLTIGIMETTDWDTEWERCKDKDIICLNYSKAALFYNQMKKCNFDFIHLDEFLIKDPKTVRTQTITDLSRFIPYKCGGSGTLINNSVLDMFAPIRYLEPSLVGTSFTEFMNRHTVKNPRDLRMVVGHRKIDEARSVLESCCIVMTKEEWLKLPPKNIHDIYVQPSDQQREFYSNLSRNFIADIDGETLEIDNALVMMSKLYQASNGFVYISDKVTESEEVSDLLATEEPKKKKKLSNRRTKFFPEQPKINAMLDLISKKVQKKRSIIWFNMQAEYELISKALENAGHTFLTIKGGTKNLGNIVREFNRNPNIQFLVCQAKSVNYGITVLGTTLEKMEDSDIEFLPGVDPSVHTQIFYSCNFSLEVYLQQQDRIHRIGQTQDCDYYRIWLNTSVEHSIKAALTEKMCIRKEMLVDIAEKLKQVDPILV